MPRLSSSSTSWYRTGLPLLWLAGFTTASITLQFSAEASNETKLAFPIATVAGFGLFAFLAFPLKHVTLEGDHLLIEGRKHKVLVPLRDVQRVSEWSAVKPEMISIYLKTNSLFGRTIRFTPEFRFVQFSAHPVVSVLREAVKKANKSAQPTPRS